MVKIQTSPQETAELTVQTQQEKISKAIDDIKKISQKENINELIDKNFLDNLYPGTAKKLLDIINNLELDDDELPRGLKDLKDALEPISSQQENFEKEVDQEFTNLPDLDTNSIKVFSDLDKNEIVNFFNEQKARGDLTHEQKLRLNLTYKWLTKRFFDKKDKENRWQHHIETLQYWFKRDDKNFVVDWKFGKQTFDAMKKRYLSGETATVNPNNTNETSDISNNSSDVMFGNEKLSIQEENGRKFVEITINWETKRYDEYKEGMTWLGYKTWIDSDDIWYSYVWNFENGKYNWQWTKTWDDWYKYEWEWKNNKIEWKGTYTLANWNKLEWEFTNRDFKSKSIFIITLQQDWSKIQATYLNWEFKVISEWKYKGMFINPETWKFIDKDSSNIQVNSHEELIQKLKDIKDNTIEYQFDGKTTFAFTKNGCHFECDGNTIDFDKSWSYYKSGDYIMYIRDNKICMYKIACKDKKIFYNTWNKFEWETDEYRNPERWTMTYKDWSTFEWSFVIRDNKLRKWEPHKVDFDDKFWD